MTSHSDLKDLLPEVEVLAPVYKTVVESSELLLKHRYPGVVGIRRTSSGLWAGTVITEKGKIK